MKDNFTYLQRSSTIIYNFYSVIDYNILVCVGFLIAWSFIDVWSMTKQDFDTPGTPYHVGQCVAPPGPLPSSMCCGRAGKFLRLATTTQVPDHNTITFDRTDPGVFPHVIVDFDFRIMPVNGRADGLGFALLNTAVPAHGTTGAVCPFNPPFAAEEPQFSQSLGVGFDIYRNTELSPPDSSDNHVSIHFNGQLLQQFPFSKPVLDLAGNQDHWIHARIIMRPGHAVPDVSVILTLAGGEPLTVVAHFPVPGLTPYEGRAWFGARSGGGGTA